MAKITDVLSIMREFAPEDKTEPDFTDNVGLLVGSERGNTDKVLLCLDATENVVSEARDLGAKLIISHHPIIFNPIKRVDDNTPTGRTIIEAIRSDIAIYSAHTNLDFCDGGINEYVSELIEMTDSIPLSVKSGINIGRSGKVKQTTLSALADKLALRFNDKNVSFVGKGTEKINNVAVINGGGGNIEFVDLAMNSGADCYVSADFPHHVRLYSAQSGFPLIIMQHYTMEAIYIKRLAEILTERAKINGLSVEFIVSNREYNPAQQEVL
ncbi:MAG: Nif3-like dinuclear metal center hexameric protein [Clostridia bacterium]|nr:Nif3-like dinuclear metal center hexameric protein [Clostridia bacterium]